MTKGDGLMTRYEEIKNTDIDWVIEKLFESATIVLLLGTHWGNLLARFISIIFGVVIWPMVIRREFRRGAELRAGEGAGGARNGN